MKTEMPTQSLRFFDTLSAIHHNRILASRRNALKDQGKGAKIFLLIISILGVLYFAFVGLMLAMLVKEDNSVNAFEFISGILPFILLADYVFRIIFKKLPAQQVMPYLLLPLSKHACTDCLLIEDMLSPFNLLWLTFILPIGVINVLPFYGFISFIGLLVALLLIIEINGQWYVLTRSLTNRSILWWLLPTCALFLIATPFFVGNNSGIDSFCNFYASTGSWLTSHKIILWSGIIIVLSLLFLINRNVQYLIIREEITTSYEVSNSRWIKYLTKSAFKVPVSFMDVKNMTGIFIRLEILNIMRNRNLRKTFIETIAILAVISALLSFTDVFSGNNLPTFWLFYSFCIFATMFLVKIMCYEGNYIDCIAVHQDSLYNILKGKYIAFVAILVIPFIILLPTVYNGVATLADLISYALLTAGLINFGYFQLAVYNNTSYSLNKKVTDLHSSINNFTQIAATIIIFSIPLSIIFLIEYLYGHTAVNCVSAATGLIFIILSPLWLKNISKRMKARKYVNIEGFRS